MKELTQSQLGWAACAIDGEGCIAIRMFSHKNSVKPQYRAEISVANCDPRMPKFMQEFFGGTVLKREQSFRRRPLYEWRIYSTNAAKVLEVLRPYLVLKGEQADIFLAFCQTIKRTGGHSDKILKARAEMHREIAALKVVNFDEEAI